MTNAELLAIRAQLEAIKDLPYDDPEARYDMARNSQLLHPICKALDEAKGPDADCKPFFAARNKLVVKHAKKENGSPVMAADGEGYEIETPPLFAKAVTALERKHAKAVKAYEKKMAKFVAMLDKDAEPIEWRKVPVESAPSGMTIRQQEALLPLFEAPSE